MYFCFLWSNLKIWWTSLELNFRMKLWFNWQGIFIAIKWNFKIWLEFCRQFLNWFHGTCRNWIFKTVYHSSKNVNPDNKNVVYKKKCTIWLIDISILYDRWKNRFHTFKNILKTVVSVIFVSRKQGLLETQLFIYFFWHECNRLPKNSIPFFFPTGN